MTQLPKFVKQRKTRHNYDGFFSQPQKSCGIVVENIFRIPGGEVLMEYIVYVPLLHCFIVRARKIRTVQDPLTSHTVHRIP
jgi:hypothetical protein